MEMSYSEVFHPGRTRMCKDKVRSHSFPQALTAFILISKLAG